MEKTQRMIPSIDPIYLDGKDYYKTLSTLLPIGNV